MSKAEQAAKDTLAAYRQVADGRNPDGTRWRHSICVDHLCGCRIAAPGRSKRLNIHARLAECHPEGER